MQRFKTIKRCNNSLFDYSTLSFQKVMRYDETQDKATGKRENSEKRGIPELFFHVTITNGL